MAPKLVSTRFRLTGKTPPVLRRQRPRWRSGVLQVRSIEDDVEEPSGSSGDPAIARGSYSYGGSSGSGRSSGSAAGSSSSGTTPLRPAAKQRTLQSAEELLTLQRAAMKGRKGKRTFMSLAEFKKASKKVLLQDVALQDAPEAPQRIGARTLTVPQQQQKLKAVKNLFSGGKHFMLKQAFIPGEKRPVHFGYFGARRGRITPKTMVDHAASASKMLPTSAGGQAFREQVEIFKADGIKVDLKAAKTAMTAVRKEGKSDFGMKHYVSLAAQDTLTCLENFKWSKDRFARADDKIRREAETRSNAKKYQKSATALSSVLLWSESAEVSSALLDKYKGSKDFKGERILTKAAEERGRRKVICGVLPETACEREITSSLLLPGGKLSGGKSLPKKLFSDDWTEIDSKTLGKIGSFALPSDIGTCQEALAASRPTGKEVSMAWVKGMSLDPFSDLGGKRCFCLQCKTFVTTGTYELRRHNIQCAGSDKGYLRNFVDETGQLMGMQLEYEHDLAKSTVALRLKAPILAIVRHALWASYWPAEGVQASWRVVSLPGQQGLRVLAEDPPPPEVKPGRQGRGGLAAQRRSPAAARSRSARRRVAGRGRGALLRRRGASSGSGRRQQDSCSSGEEEEAKKDQPAEKMPELPSAATAEQGPLFTMMDSLDVPKAVQPRGFVLPLKSEQLHTLGWMHRREGRAYPGSPLQEGGFNSTELAQRRFGSTDLVLQVRIQRHYEHARGGILGDVVGYGKTACMIGLIAETADDKLQASLSPKEEELCSKLIFTSATLIITPPNLFGQWRDEFTKFLGKDNQLRFVEIVDFTALKRLRVQDIVAADVVLISFRFFFSEAYQRSLDDQVNPNLKVENSKFKDQQKKNKEAKEKRAEAQKAAASSPAPYPPQYPAFGYGGFFGGPFGYRPFQPRREQVTRFTKEYKQLKQKPDYLASRIVKAHRLAEQQLGNLGPDDLMQEPTILEQFYWHRVVFDEFHEVLKLRKGIPYYSLRQLNARYSWGLTATPPLDSAQGVSDMASLLHVHVQASVDAGKAFLDEWVRSNSWDVTSVPLEEHWHLVNHTRIERALYLHQKHQLDQQRRTGEGGAVFRQEQRLLMLCSHFAPEGPDEAKNAKAAAKNTQRQQQESLVATLARIKTLEAEKAKLVAKQALLERLADLVPMPQRQVLVAHMPVAELELFATKLESLDEAKREKLVEETFASGDLAKVWAEHGGRIPRPGMCTVCDEVPAFLHLITEKSKLIGRHRAKQQDNEASMRYFENALKALEEDKDKQDHECSVCLDNIAPEQLAITRCGHVFHEACIHELIPVQKACPHCRQPLSMNCVTRVQDALVASEADSASSAGSDPDVQRYGSKFAAVLACIRDIRKTEPDAKVILFLQWEQLAHEVERALTAAKLAPLTLRGATRQREKLIGSFTSSEEFKCLVLSLEQSPSGMNLTVANHIILVHPMHAENHAAAVACERQAIGRIRRQGQTKTCHVHRFFTNRTIEQDLVKKNHAEGVKSQRRGNKNAK